MKRIAAAFTLATFLLVTTGCHSVHYSHTSPDGERYEVWIQSFILDSALNKLTIDTPIAKVNLEGYSHEVNTETINAITAGVVEGIGKTFLPLP